MQEQDLKEAGCLQGGVLTPASALGTVLLKRLSQHDIFFSVDGT